MVTASFGRYQVKVDVGGYCRFDIQPTNSLHRHDFFELCLVTEGSGQYKHGGTYPLAVGDVFVGGANVPHEISSYQSRDLEVFFLTFTVTAGLPIATAISAEEALISRFLACPKVVAAGNPRLRHYLPLLDSAYRSEPAKGVIPLFLLELMGSLSPAASSEPETAMGVHQVEEAMAYVYQNMGRRIGLSELAAHLGVSARTLGRRFREVGGRSVAQEILHQKMVHAAHQLLMGFPVHEVAYRVGVHDPAQFTRAFRRTHGVNPKAFQRTYRPGLGVSRTWMGVSVAEG